MIDRMARVEAMIKREISSILQEEVNDPRARDVSITKVEVTRDLKLAKVFYIPSCGDNKKEDVARGLKRSASFIRHELAERISLKFIPRISFREDVAEEKKEKIDSIFDRIRKEHTAEE